MHADSPARFVRVAEVAEILSLSRGKTYHLIAEGTIPSRNFGGSIRVPKAWIESLEPQVNS